LYFFFRAQFIDQARFIGIWRHQVLLQSYRAVWSAPLWISSIKNVSKEAPRPLKIIRIKIRPKIRHGAKELCAGGSMQSKVDI